MHKAFSEEEMQMANTSNEIRINLPSHQRNPSENKMLCWEYTKTWPLQVEEGFEESFYTLCSNIFRK